MCVCGTKDSAVCRKQVPESVINEFLSCAACVLRVWRLILSVSSQCNFPVLTYSVLHFTKGFLTGAHRQGTRDVFAFAIDYAYIVK